MDKITFGGPLKAEDIGIKLDESSVKVQDCGAYEIRHYGNMSIIRDKNLPFISFRIAADKLPEIVMLLEAIERSELSLEQIKDKATELLNYLWSDRRSGS